MTISTTVKKYLPEDTTTKSKILEDKPKNKVIPEDTAIRSKILKDPPKQKTWNY